MVRKFLFIQFILILGITKVNAQYNYVYNSSLDSLNTCYPYNDNWWTNYDHWMFSYGISDFYNECVTDNSLIINWYMSPRNNAGYQKPHSGTGYIGFLPFAYYPDLLPNYYPNVREVVAQRMKKKLKPQVKYLVRFYANLADTCGWAINRLGLAFSKDSLGVEVTDGLNFNDSLKPVIEWDSTKIFNDSINWHKISGTYTANGTEKYITISNFYSDTNTSFIITPRYDSSGNSIKLAAYYYIDDVSIYEITRSTKSTRKICNGIALKGRNNYKRYEWQNDDSLQTYVPNSNGTYTVISYSDTSLAIDTFVVELQTAQSISIVGDSICTQGTEVTLNAPPNYASYNWSTGATNQSIIIAPQSNTKYTVIVTDEYGCEATAKKAVAVKPKLEVPIIVPTLLSKSKTKLWQILNLPTNTNLSLYDILGNEIMHTNNYLNNYDYSNLANAFYIYRLITSDGTALSGKIVVLE